MKKRYSHEEVFVEDTRDDVKVLVITGASSGIGRMIALEASPLGYSLVLVSRSQEALSALAYECERNGATVLVIPRDVSKEDQVQDVCRHAVAHFGQIDVWINNAAVSAYGTFEDIPSDVFRQVMDTNFFGYVYGARAVLPHFLLRHKGTLINISSVLGKVGLPYQSPYIASKFAVSGFSEALRHELREEKDIHVCTVFPATIDTPFCQHAANFTGRKIKPINPIYPPEMVAEAVLSLIETPKREITVGDMAKLMSAQHEILPGQYDSMMPSYTENQLFDEGDSPLDTGNVFSALMETNYDLRGGWLEHEKAVSGKKVDSVVKGVVAVGIVGIYKIVEYGMRVGK